MTKDPVTINKKSLAIDALKKWKIILNKKV